MNTEANALLQILPHDPWHDVFPMRGAQQSQPKRQRPMRNQSDNGLLDISHAADLLGVSAKWLYRNYRDLPHVLIPAGKRPRIRFRRNDLEQWIANHSFDWRKRR